MTAVIAELLFKVPVIAQHTPGNVMGCLLEHRVWPVIGEGISMHVRSGILDRALNVKYLSKTLHFTSFRNEAILIQKMSKYREYELQRLQFGGFL